MPGIGYQLIKCGVTNEIKLIYEKCPTYRENLPIIGAIQKERFLSTTGEAIDWENQVKVSCKIGRHKPGKRTVETIGDAY
jgi:hypothetical protein